MATVGGPSAYEQDLVQQEVAREGEVQAEKEAVVANLIGKSEHQPAADELPPAIDTIITAGVSELMNKVGDQATRLAAQELGVEPEKLMHAVKLRDEILDKAEEGIRRNFLTPRERQQQMNDIYKTQYGNFSEADH